MPTAAVPFLCLLGAAAATHRLSAEYYRTNKGAMWAAFKHSHNKQYKDPEEEARREANYHRNMGKAMAAQERNPHASFGHGVFSDLSEDELKAYHSGYAAPKETMLASPATDEQMQRASARLDALSDPDVCHTKKEHLDWTTVGAVGHIKDQGQCGSCFAFASIAALEAQWVIQGHAATVTSLSEQFALQCGAAGTNGCGPGDPEAFLTQLLAKTNGVVVPETALPYTLVKGPTAATLPPCPPASPVGAQYTDVTPVLPDEKEFYAALLNGPVVVAVDASTVWAHYTGGIVTDCMLGPGATVDHAVLLVGHGYDPASDVMFWIVKNSWGTSWGEAGYIRMQYGTNTCLVASVGGHVPVVSTLVQTGREPIEWKSPEDPKSAPAYIDRLDPFEDKDEVAQKAAWCAYGPDCECPHWLGMEGKVGNICGGALMALVLLLLAAFLIGLALGACFCGTPPKKPSLHRKKNTGDSYSPIL
eukprot:TRINITY_DN8055_c0_g1_i1.p1 TRINITY_DN8055_c0_g1~~TRINITY_DN8055_c0_g1_i1.p1  ORF type:complete len:485 (+),score=121.17 TRINITY_DN8055_c0_g1_i1:33-1457(+)